MYKKALSLLMAAMTASVLLTGCISKKAKEKVQPIYVTADVCEPHLIVQNVNVSGVVESKNAGIYAVSTNITDCRIKSLNVRSGDEVKEGDVICEFDTADLEKKISSIEEQLKSSQSSDEQNINGLKEKIAKLNDLLDVKLEQIARNQNADQEKYDSAVRERERIIAERDDAQAQYDEAQAQLETASEDERDHYAQLCETLLMTSSERESEADSFSAQISELKARLDDYPYQIRIAKLETEQQTAEIKLSIDAYQGSDELTDQLNELKRTLKDSVVYAPCSGTVKDVNVVNGEVCSTSTLVTIVETDKKTVHASVSDSDSLIVKEGMSVDILVGRETVIGTVTRVNPIKSEMGFDVYISLSEPEKANIGMSVSNSINIIREELLSVNKQGILERDGVSYVFVAVPQEDGSYIAEEKQVTVGVQDEENAEIRSGLTEGDLVVTDMAGSLRNGDLIGISQ